MSENDIEFLDQNIDPFKFGKRTTDLGNCTIQPGD